MPTIRGTARFPWLAEETAFYASAATYHVDPREAWRRLTRARSPEGRGLAVLREVAAWREDAARSQDQPRGRVLTDDIVVEIARRAPQQPQDLAEIRGLNQVVIARHGQAILAAVAAGVAPPPGEWPVAPRPRREDPQQALVVDLMEVFVRKRALEAEIAPSYLASRRDLVELFLWLRAEPRAAAVPALLEGWRHELVGAELIAMAEGRVALRVAAQGSGGLSSEP